MSTYAAFYYDFLVDDTNRGLDFSDGSGSHSILIPKGGYTLTSLAVAIAREMTKNSTTNNYLVEANRSSRIYTISADLPFALLFNSGFSNPMGIFNLIGFNDADYNTGSNFYIGSLAAGKAYYPQFYLKNYIDAENSQNPLSAVVNRSSNGENYEIVKFGSQNFYKFEIIYTTDLQVGQNCLIKENLNGVEDLREFMKYCSKKHPIEFMKDVNNPNVFDKVILESTPQSQDGVGFEIIPDYGQDLPEYFVMGGPLVFKRLS
jgi:hypothetical protein